MKYIKLLSIVVALFGFTVIVSAQTMEDVVNARNNGANFMASGNLDEAIVEFEKCIELAIQVGEEAEMVQIEIEGALPNLYLQRVSKIPRDDHSALLQALEATVAIAEKYNDTRAKENAERQIPQIYVAIGNKFRSEQKFEEAIANFEEAISINPNIAIAYFLKGVCYESMRDEPNMDESYKLAIEKGKESGDAQNARQAQERLRNYHRNAGARANTEAQTMENNKRPQRDVDAKFNDAIVSFTKALEVDDRDFDSYRGLITSYNGLKRWDDAIANGEKALEIKDSGADAIWYGLGVAYVCKKDNAKACESFKKVTTSEQRLFTAAKEYITNFLKCN